jgi:hypothetical protein
MGESQEDRQELGRPASLVNTAPRKRELSAFSFCQMVKAEVVKQAAIGE